MLRMWILMSLLFSASVCCQTLVHNVNGYHIENGHLKTFSAIAFDHGKVTQLYRQKPKADAYSDVIDGKGQTLLPGLIDAHGHVYGYGLTLSWVNLMGVTSLQESISLVSAYAETNPNSDWIAGRGWNQELWPGRAFPNASDLDKISDEIPIVLGRVDGHALWVNSAALELAGIDDTTLSPAGGEIIRDANGKATGILIDNAMDLVYKIQPKASLASVKETLVKSLNKLASLGLTSVHDAGIDYMTFQAYKSLHQENKLPIRVYAMLDVTDPRYPDMLAQGHYLPEDAMLAIRSVKISADGALGSRGAALHEPYSDDPENYGLLLHTENRLNALTQQAMQAGFQVNTHAIGDKANTLALDSFAKWISETQTKELRHRIEHAQVVRPGEITRFAELGIIASMQPTHATSDKNMAQDRIGAERMKGAYAWQTLLDHNVVIAGGSDFPVEPAEPMFGLHAAITRQDRDNQPLGGWYSGESVTATQALSMFTIDAAYSGHQEHIIGSLHPGKAADFVLLQEDPFQTNPQLVWQIQVTQTWVAGKSVFTQ